LGRPLDLEDWHLEAVELMARTGVSLATAATELGKTGDKDGFGKILRRASFQRLLWEARHRYFNSLGSDPNFKKDTAIGKLLSLAQRLEEAQDFSAASEIYFKISKMMNWVGPESTVNVFGELSQKDLDAIRVKINSEKGTSKPH
jgi:hypothetical protein